MTVTKDFKVRLVAEVDDKGSYKAAEADISRLSGQFDHLIAVAERMSAQIADFAKQHAQAYRIAEVSTNQLALSQARVVDRYAQSNMQLAAMNSRLGVTGKEVRGVSAGFDSLGGSFASGSANILAFVDVLERVATVLRFITSDQTLTRTGNLLAIFAALANLKGMPGLSNALEDASGRVRKLQANVQRFRLAAEDDFTGAAIAADLFNNKLQLIGMGASGAVNGVMQVGQAISQTTAVIANASMALDALMDPMKFQAVSDVFKVLQAVAVVKGFDDTAAAFGQISDSAGGAAAKLQEFRDGSGTALVEARQKAELFIAAVDGIQTALVVAGGAFATWEAGKVMVSTGVAAKVFPTINADLERLKVTAGGLGKLFGEAFKPSILSTVETLLLMQPALFAIGGAMRQSENETVRLTGAAMQLAAVLTGGFAVAMAAALGAVSNLAISMGGKLWDSMAAFEKVAYKAERQAAAFTYTVVNFGEELGKSAVGSINFWNKQVEDTVKTTAFSIDAVRKSVKLLVSEGSQLGVTVEQNSKLLKTAADVASASGKELDEVTMALLNGITGNSQAALALGIDLRDTALAHHEVAYQTGYQVSAMSDLEKQQSRVNLIFERTKPLLGAAAHDLETVAGATQKFDSTLLQLQSRLGAAGIFTRKFIVLKQQLLQKLIDLPPRVVETVGVMQDFGSVILTVTGTFMKYFFAISTFLAIGKVVNALIVSSTIAQTALNIAFTAGAAALGAQVVPVVGLTSAYANLLVIMRAVGASIAGELLSTLGKLGGLFWTVIRAVAPFAIKIGLVVAVAYAFILAIKELSKEMGFFDDLLWQVQKAFGGVSSGASLLDSALKAVTDTVILAFNMIKQLAKLLITGLVTSGLLAAKAMLYLTEAVTFQSMADKISAVDDALVNMNQVASSALLAMVTPLEQTANAAEYAAQQIKKATDESQAFQSALSMVRGSLDMRDIKVDVLGDEYQKALLAAQQAQIEAVQSLDKLTTAGNIKIEDRMKLEEDAAKANVTSTKAYLAIKKLQIDTMDKLKESERMAAVETAKSQGQLVEVAKLESAERLKAFEKTVAGLKTLGGLYGQNLIRVNRMRDALAKQAEAQIEAANLEQIKKAAEEQKKLSAEQEQAVDRAFKKLDDLKKAAVDAEYENAKVNASARQRIDLEFEKGTVVAETLRSELQGLGLLDEATQSIIDQYIKAADAKRELAKADLGVGSLTFPEVGRDIGAAAKAGWDSFQNGLGSGNMAAAAASVGAGFEAAWFKVVDKIKKITLEDVGRVLATIVSGTAQAATAIFSGQAVDEFAGVVDSFGNFPKALLEAFDKLGAVVTDLIRNLPAIIQKLIASVPQIVDAFVKGFPKVIDMLLAALPQIAKTLADAIPKLLQSVLDALPKLIAAVPQMLRPLIAAIPGMITQIMDALPEIIQSLMEAIPQIIADIFKAIPAIMENFLDKLPDVILAMVEGISSALGDIAASFIDTFIMRGGAERIIGALLRAVPKLIIALVQGIARGLAKSFQALGRVLGGGIKMPASITDLPGKIEDAASKLGAKIAKESSELFQVKDLESALKSTDSADRMGSAISGATTAAVEKLRGAWDKLIQAWQWVYNTILKPLGDMLYAVWSAAGQILNQAFGLLKTIWDAAVMALTAVWGVIKAGWDAVIGALGAVWSTIKAGWDQVLGALGSVGTTIFNGLKAGLEGASSLFSSIGTKIWEGAKRGFDTLGQMVKDALDKVNPQNLLQKMFKVDGGGTGTVEQALKIDVPWAKFAHGMVPGTARVPGDSYANDNVLALVSPGEAIIPRTKMANPMIAEVIKSVMDGTLDLPRFAFGLPSLPSLPQVPSGGVGQVVDLLSKLDPTSGLWTMVQNQVWEGLWNGIRHNSFAEGGIVGASAPLAAVGGGSGMFPVEQSFPRAPMFTPTMNMRASPVAGGTQVTYVVEQINIHARTNMTPESIRREIVPAVEKELRRKSQDGIRVIDPAGVRK